VIHFRKLTLSWEERELILLKALNGELSNSFIEGSLRGEDYLKLQSNDSFPHITNEQLLTIRNQILKLQSDSQNTLDDTVKSRLGERQEFDRLLSNCVMQLFPMTPYEANTAEIWDFITLRLLPDVAVWRFSPSTERNITDRFVFNRVRHVFARWWIRQNVIQGSSILESTYISEAEWEVIFERPSLCWNKNVARAGLRVIIDTHNIEKFDKENSNSVEAKIQSGRHREWVKSIQRFTSVSTFDAFSEDELYEIFRSQHPLLKG